MKNWKKGSKGYILFLIRKRKINIWLRVGKQDKKRKYRSIKEISFIYYKPVRGIDSVENGNFEILD